MIRLRLLNRGAFNLWALQSRSTSQVTPDDSIGVLYSSIVNLSRNKARDVTKLERKLTNEESRYDRVKRSENLNMIPVALQFLYGGSSDVQRTTLDSAVLEADTDTGQKLSKEPVYPFALYDSIGEAKEAGDAMQQDTPKGRRRPRSRERKVEQVDVFETNQPKEAVKQMTGDDMFRFGGADSSVEPSQVPCGRCGAHLHCQDAKMPGFVPWEIFNGKREAALRKIHCQRCHFMEEYHVALKMNVHPEDYPLAIGHLKDEKAIVVLIVDLVDFPGSVWPDILHLLGPDKRIFLVGNKVDLLPQDSDNYLDRIQHSMVKSFYKKCHQSSGNSPKLLDSMLVSARTGYNIEWLITRLFLLWRQHKEHVGGDVYLVGTTNVGKSSIFNALLDSDMCKISAIDRVDKALTSPVPGTTLNLLKFPILRPDPSKLSMRHSRLKQDSQVVRELDAKRMEKLRESKSRKYTVPLFPVGQTFLYKRDQSQKMKSSGLFDINVKPEQKNKLAAPIDPGHKSFAKDKWCYDTPGSVSTDQIINLLTQEEVMVTLPNLPIRPKSFSLKVGHTIFLGGIGRLDIVRGPEEAKWKDDPLCVTAFCSDDLPIHVVRTEDAEKFYQKALAEGRLKAPDNSSQQRLDEFPPLECVDIDVDGVSLKESSCDIVLSSVGWLACTPRVTLIYGVRAWTPGGKGIFVRDPPFLPFAGQLRGSRIKGTPAYNYGQPFVPHR